MKTHFLVEFPHIHGLATEVYNSTGNPLNRRARMDDRRKSKTVLETDRTTFDSVRMRDGTLGKHRPYSPWPVANVDFESTDGQLFGTAEECLAHELKTRFGVESLDELQAKLGQPAASQESFDSPISAVESAIKAKGQTPDQIAEATQLHVQDVNNIVEQNPHLFKRGAGGRIYLLPQES